MFSRNSGICRANRTGECQDMEDSADGTLLLLIFNVSIKYSQVMKLHKTMLDHVTLFPLLTKIRIKEDLTSNTETV